MKPTFCVTVQDKHGIIADHYVEDCWFPSEAQLQEEAKGYKVLHVDRVH